MENEHMMLKMSTHCGDETCVFHTFAGDFISPSCRRVRETPREYFKNTGLQTPPLNEVRYLYNTLNRGFIFGATGNI